MNRKIFKPTLFIVFEDARNQAEQRLANIPYSIGLPPTLLDFRHQSQECMISDPRDNATSSSSTARTVQTGILGNIAINYHPRLPTTVRFAVTTCTYESSSTGGFTDSELLLKHRAANSAEVEANSRQK
ncbi:hypothetical protein BDP27DRAFT_1369446 [Rhodocollybia butyracea]|uniref:Uncharacterized protein n=1 Tax=Rhodocollybia butyracea TaxID=206335 RepID=A0A9P5PGJ5_9AGAR|nr:hypothetical protein BDP27DRAFT_1369446 [Rhodocollybia butyracea]